MSTIVIKKEEYNILKSKAEAYNKMAEFFAMTTIEKPIKEVVKNFEKTGKYSKGFLRDLKEGLTDLRKSKSWK